MSRQQGDLETVAIFRRIGSFLASGSGMLDGKAEAGLSSCFDLRRKRVLIFIVAYNAEFTIERALTRIPASLYQHDVEVLIIDDSSRANDFFPAEKRLRLAYARLMPAPHLSPAVAQSFGEMAREKLGRWRGGEGPCHLLSRACESIRRTKSWSFCERSSENVDTLNVNPTCFQD